MTDLRYAAPATAVADPAEQRSERPRRVTRAVWLLWIAMVVALPSVVYDTMLMGLSGVIAYFVLALPLSCAINVFIARGRNWARILLAIFMVLSLLSLPELLMGNVPPLIRASNLFGLALDLGAIWLLFTQEAARWFRAAAFTSGAAEI